MSAFPEIPGYRIERRLGEGGMASVYLATQLSLDRPVAIKVVHFRGHAHDQMAVRFEHEARTIARLEHPNIVGIYEVGRTSQGLPYYSMAYLPNGDLTHAQFHGQAERIAEVLRMIAQALAFAHSHGVVHRDVKPDNVLFDREQRARLADFGISRSLGSVRVTMTGDAMGSSAYMSPEQARGHEVDARSDLYSLGVMAFEMLTGELPYRGDDPVAMAMAHHMQPIPRLPVPYTRWQPLIDRSLAKRVEDRVADAEEFIEILDHITSPVDMHRTEVAPEFAPPMSALAKAPSPKPAAADVPVLPVAPTPRAVLLTLLTVLLILTSFGVWQRWLSDEATASNDLINGSDLPDPKLTVIKDRIENRHWFEPKDGSASVLLAAALAEQKNDERMDVADRFVEAVHGAVVEAIADAKDAQATEWVVALRAFITEQNLQGRETAGAFEQSLANAIDARLNVAEAAAEATTVEALARLLNADPSFQMRWQKLASLRQPGQSLQDKGGPPMRLIKLDDAWVAIGAHEITRAEFRRFAEATKRDSSACREFGAPTSLLRPRTWREPGYKPNEKHPVVCVSYDDARAYAAWLSQQTGQRYRLPSAGEWRAAAVGVNIKAPACGLGNVYAMDGRDLNLRERFDCQDRAEETAEVGRYAASAQGLHDLVGNVSEWVADCAAQGDCDERKIMGSSYRDGRAVSLLGLNDTKDRDSASLDVGFRVARDLN